MRTNKTKKGFTLMELVIVLAILGILLAIIVPSWGYFIRRSRERSANAKAKVVFNAAQTEVTRVSMKERPSDAQKNIYIGDGDFYFYWDGHTGKKVNAAGTAVTADAAQNRSFSDGINNINNNGDGCYKIYVSNYNVQAVVYSEMADGRYKGTYPKGMDELTSTQQGTIRSTNVRNINLNSIT
jgi:prepilin-type N-terminal cleavage/methylation domain-containing protein